MRFYREKTEEYFLADTRVENMFIHEFMAAAPDRYVKVYLLALMHADLGVRISREEIARHLSMDEEDVLKAWTYWEQMGVIRKRAGESGDKFDYDVEFVSLRQQMYGSVGEQSRRPDDGPRGQGHDLRDRADHRTGVQQHRDP